MNFAPLKLYKASAGSGKTFTLAVEYIKLLIRNPQNYRHILAVTFTNKATAEMKQRILSQLYGIGHGLKDSEDYMQAICNDAGIRSLALSEQSIRQRALEALSMMMHDYSRFRIETIDSFFQSIIRELARELDLTANLRIDLNDNEVLEEAVAGLIGDLQQGTELFQSVYEFVQERISEDKNWRIDAEVARFGRNIFNEEYIERGGRIRHVVGDRRFLKEYKQRIAAEGLGASKQLTDTASSFLEACGEMGYTADDFAGKSRGIYAFFDKMAQGEVPNISASVEKALSNPQAWAPKGRNDVAALAETTFMAMLRQAVAAIHILNTSEAIGQHINKMMLIDEIDKRVRLLNADANRFLLADTAHFLRELISDSDIPFIYERTGVRFTHIMIDEFQDTSRLQWQNFTPLIRNSLSTGSECLLVGDVKQSIYRWRNSDWGILNNMQEGQFGPAIDAHQLDTNYRSGGQVVGFNNDFFEKAANELNLLYKKKTGHESADIGRAYSDVVQKTNPKLEGKGYVGVECIEKNKERSTDDMYLERLVCRVQQLLEAGVQASDICILIRKNDQAQLITQHFEQTMPGIRIVNGEAYRLDSSPAVCIVVLALTLLNNPSDHFTRILLAHRYQLCVEHNEDMTGRLDQLVGLDEEGVSRLLPDEFCQHTDELAATPLYELAERLYHIFHLSRIDGQDAYLFAFYDELTDYLTDKPADIDNFLHHWQEQMRSKTVPSGSIDGIRVMTIHKSKGLEFHTVIVPFCEWQLGKGNDLLWCEPDSHPYDQLPLLPVTNKQALVHSIFKSDYEQELLKSYVDNLNILYVAFTRAKWNLVVISEKGGESSVGGLIQKVVGNQMPGEWGDIVPTQQKAERRTDNVLAVSPRSLEVPFQYFPSSAQFLQSNQSKAFLESDDEQLSTDYIDRGILFHNLLADIKNANDVEAAVRRFENMGYFPSTLVRDELLATVRQALRQPEAAKWFDSHWQVFNECAIIYTDPSGITTQRRPDRVITDGEETIVIDYKTGHPRAEHKRQVCTYMQLLQQMGYTRVKGYLWYVNSESPAEEVVEVRQEAESVATPSAAGTSDSFLALVAADLYDKYQGHLQDVTLVFPNKRASLFMNQHLLRLNHGAPLWSPRYTTISELFQQMSELTVADPIMLVCLLYKTYKQVTGNDITLDKFYSWGEMLIADFDDIDNNMTDAQHLFLNIKELDELTDLSFLTPEQIQAIEQYFKNFEPAKHTRLKDKFQATWSILLPLYEQFRSELRKQNLAYEGMLKRDVVEQLLQPTANTHGEHIYAIVGFNVLNETERQLFQHFKASATTHFYWDYDTSYLRANAEAGRFIRDNIQHFGSELPATAPCYHHMAEAKRIDYIASPTNTAQTRFVSQWLKEHPATDAEPNQTAIVLCDENLLQPLLHSISTPCKLNVTMGYPLQQTPISSYLLSLLDLQLHGQASADCWRYVKVANVLKHPYTGIMAGKEAQRLLRVMRETNMMFPSQQFLGTTPFLLQLFTPQPTNRLLLLYMAEIVKTIGQRMADGGRQTANSSPLYAESVFDAYTLLNRLLTILETNLLNVTPETLLRLLRQIIASTTIPFHGEPAVGMQVMGLLETRNLDFRHLVLLSANEGMLPRPDHRPSFIPYTLRQAHGMTTIERQNSLYAYYFYRLLQRAEHATILYNNSTDASSKGEMSRFMMQLLIDSNHTIGQHTIVASGTAGKTIPLPMALESSMPADYTYLSPTALKSYIHCPLQFYLRYAAKLKIDDEVNDEVGNDVFGTIFHHCMEVIYRQHFPPGHDLQADQLLALRRDLPLLRSLVDRAFNQHFFKLPPQQYDRQPRYSGEQLLNREAIISYVRNQLAFDAQLCPLRIVATETDDYALTIPLDQRSIRLGGIIDRIDLATLPNPSAAGQRQLRVVDYKTSTVAQKADSVAQLFDPDAPADNSHILQALYYSNILATDSPHRGQPIAPALMYVKKAAKSVARGLSIDDCVISLDTDGPILDFDQQCRPAFQQELHKVVRKIFDPNTTFAPNPEARRCSYCDFHELCSEVKS